MASGSISLSNSSLTSGGGYLAGKIDWESTPNTAANTSQVKAKLYVKKASTTGTITIPTIGSWDCALSVNGESVSSSVQASITADWVLMLEKTVTVAHGSDGTKSITISGVAWGVSGSAYSGKSTTGSGTATLDPIPRASTMSFPSTWTLGTTQKFTISRADSSFRHSIEYGFGSGSTKKSGHVGGSDVPFTATSVTFTPGLEFCEAIPNAASGTGTFILRTYTASGTMIGSKTYNVTYNVPVNDNTRPNFEMALTPVNSISGEAFQDLYIQGYSKVDADFANGTGKYGATVKSYEMTVEGKSYGSPYTSGYLSQTGQITVTGKATDSRGLTNSIQQTIDVIPYSTPNVNVLFCGRCDDAGDASDSGTNLRIQAKRSYSKVISGDVQKNFCEIRYRYKTVSAASYSGWATILQKGSTVSDEVDTGVILSGLLSLSSSYVVEIGVTDDIGQSASATITIPTATVFMHRKAGGSSMGLGKYAEEDDLLDVAWNQRVRKDLRVDGNLTVSGDSANVYDIDVQRYARIFHGMEIGMGAESHGGYIDFHYPTDGGEDYTSRIIENASGELLVNALLKMNLATKSRIYSQTDDGGAKTAATIKAYPTEAGIYRVGAQVAGLPSGGTGYGVLVIWDGGSYAFHLYRDNSGTLYTSKNSTSNDKVQKPSSWSKHAGTSVSVQT